MVAAAASIRTTHKQWAAILKEVAAIIPVEQICWAVEC